MATLPAFEFSDSFRGEVERTADRMMEEGALRMEIPNSDGMILVLSDSDVSKQSEHSEFIAPFERAGKIFIVCAK